MADKFPNFFFYENICHFIYAGIKLLYMYSIVVRVPKCRF